MAAIDRVVYLWDIECRRRGTIACRKGTLTATHSHFVVVVVVVI